MSTTKGKGKRRAASALENTPSKHSRSEVIEITDSDEDENMDTILARIRELEERERRDRVHVHSTPGTSNVIVLDDTEGDEVLARRLAEEWGELDPGESKASAKVQHLSESDDDVQIVEVPKGNEVGSRSGTFKPSQRRDLKTTAVNEPTAPPDKQLSEFRAFFTGKRDCSKCRTPISPPRGYVMFKSTDSKVAPSIIHLLHVPCSSCKTNHCRGCWTAISCPVTCKGAPKKGECSVITCCAGSRAVAVFETLGGLDRQFIGERATAASRAQAVLDRKKSNDNHSSVGPGGTGYGTGGGGGYPRGGGALGNWQNSTFSKTSRAEKLEKHWDEIIVRAFNTLTELLPAPYSDSAQIYDLVPHASIGALLSLSRLQELLASLLRNDSITEWTERSETYSAMLLLLRRMADCELTVQVLLERRWEVANPPGLEPWMWNEQEIAWQKDKSGVVERSPPLYDYFRKLIKQSEAFMATVSNAMEAGDGADQETLTQAVSLCGDIIAVGGDIERVISILGAARTDQTTASKGKGKEDPAAFLDKAYRDACEELAFKHIALGSENKDGTTGFAYPNFKFAANLKQTESSTRNPTNQFRLASELAMMATSLPPGVWVRVDEVRNDAIKIMIAGPEGTPYEGGLFEFDCFIPLEYPNVPPLVNLCTTGGGSVRFNPNLYNCGKVCLSLLGTWNGRPEEQWGPKSTLLQVIVSIQSMILIETPYFNEPGYGKANPTAPASITYNRNISIHTIRWAILDWLQQVHLDGLWGAVIASHFGITKNKIRERLIRWVDDASATPPTNHHFYGGNGVAKEPLIAVSALAAEYDKRIRLVDV